MNRLYTLDYLRGIAAVCIMIYHYLYWTFGSFSSETIMGRIGVYGVSIFYVLSGLTLYYVYYDKMTPTGKDVYDFFKKRIFRIFPLLWLTTIAAIILSKKMPDFFDFFLNISGLFGFVKWEAYFSTGVWSIGNELVFYAFFPFFVFFTKKSQLLMIVLCALVFLFYLYFAFYRLNSSLQLSLQWVVYINPLNQVFLFLGGFLIGKFLHDIKMTSLSSLCLLIAGVLLFIYIPSIGDTIAIVTGMNRIYFTISCFLICIGIYKMSIELPKFIHDFFSFLGEISYSVYLLHSIVFSLVNIVLSFLGNYAYYPPLFVKLSFSVLFTLIISHFIYKYFEKYFIKKGSRVR